MKNKNEHLFEINCETKKDMIAYKRKVPMTG